MGQSLVQIYVHLVFSAKHRQPFLKDAEFRAQTHAYLAGIARNLDSAALIVGGVEDHVHLLVRLGKQIDVSQLVRELKRDSSKWIKDERPQLSDFYWQDGYGAFSVSPAHVDDIGEVHHQSRGTSSPGSFPNGVPAVVCQIWGGA